MSSLRNGFVSFLLLLFFFLLDLQISDFFSSLLPGLWEIHLHLFLFLLMFFSLDVSENVLLLISFILGFLLDLAYLHRLGVLLLILPVLSFLLARLNKVLLLASLNRLAAVIILVFAYEWIVSAYGILLGVSNLSLDQFIFYHLAPSLVLNLVFYLFLQPIFKKLHLM